MIERERRQAWLIVAVLWITLFLVVGSDNGTTAVFFTPLLKEFGWSRARVSTFTAAISLMSGLTAPVVGWLLDRIDARVSIIAGAIISAIACLLAGHAHSYAALLTAYIMLGVGVGAAGMVPCLVVIANWFGKNRGTAMGAALSGHSLGASGMIIVANYLIMHQGWRFGYKVLAIPLVLVVIPLVFFVVKSRPESSGQVSIREAGERLPGLEVSEAAHTRSFWMILLAMFLYGFTVSAGALHTLPYLLGLGYTASSAAGFLSLIWIGSGTGRFLLGMLADRIGPRATFVINFSASALGIFLLFHAANPAMLVLFVILFGLGSGSPSMLLALIAANSLGLKRYGSLNGIMMLVMTLGTASGPIITGRIFDVTGSYNLAFNICIVMYLVGICAALACRPLAIEQAALAPTQSRAVA